MSETVTVLVCGGRDYADRATVFNVLDMLHAEAGVGRVVHGAASGADTLAGEWARERRVPFAAYPADWRTHGRPAGPIRNAAMLAAEEPHVVVAFPGGRGTADMVQRAHAAGVQVLRVNGDGSLHMCIVGGP